MSDKKTVTLRMSAHIWEMAKACADSIDQSLNQFFIQAATARAMNWRDPRTNQKLVKALAAEGSLVHKTPGGHVPPSMPGDLHHLIYCYRCGPRDSSPVTAAACLETHGKDLLVLARHIDDWFYEGADNPFFPYLYWIREKGFTLPADIAPLVSSLAATNQEAL